MVTFYHFLIHFLLEIVLDNIRECITHTRYLRASRRDKNHLWRKHQRFFQNILQILNKLLGFRKIFLYLPRSAAVDQGNEHNIREIARDGKLIV